MSENRPDCMKCKYFYITWDKSFPRGCRLYGFKTGKMPYMLVKEATGEMCKNYTSKELSDK